MYILDTDHIGILQRQRGNEYEVLSRRMAAHIKTEFHTSIVTFHEQLLGWNAYIARAKDQSGIVRGYGKLEQILTDFANAQILPFDEAAAEVFDDLRAQKVRVSTMDLRIASIALATGMMVLSRNLVDFHRVPNLQAEDWTLS
jgi:tRNA(fMet)-specific endonuclease VapC